MIHYNGIIIDRADMTITHRGRVRKFIKHSGTQKQKYIRQGTSMAFDAITYIILAGGRATKEGMYELVYGHCKHGGPNDGIHIFDVRLCQWVTIFEELDLQLVKNKGCGIMHYDLVPKPEVPFSVIATAERIAAHVVR